MWAGLLSLVFIVLGLALVGGGALFAVVGVQAVLTPDDTGHAVAGVLFAMVGLAAVGGGVLVIWGLLPRAVLRPSEHKPPHSPAAASPVASGEEMAAAVVAVAMTTAEELLTPGKGRIKSMPSAE